MSASFVVNLFINHTWQSSGFAALAGLVAFTLRRNSPKVRYWIWLSASLKFLVPFALLVSLGSLVPRPDRQPASPASPVFSDTLVQMAESFSPAADVRVPMHASWHWVPVAVGVVWFLGFFVIALSRWRSWLRVRAALLAGTPVELPIPVPALITRGTKEPGIVGFLHPILVLPAQLLEHLSPRQLGAILTHELCHVRRRDNFFAAFHMVVEAIFWFHPMVWWIGSRMVEERELACDEEVVRMGCEPSDYVEGILTVCRFYTESPLPCVSGVTGADVKKRLRAILDGRIARELTARKKAILAAVAVAALLTPIVIGVLTAPVIQAQSAPANTPKFDVASIKRCEPGPRWRAVAEYSPGRMNTGCLPLAAADSTGLIQRAYVRFAGGRMNPAGLLPITGGPAWVRSDFYQIEATAEGSPRPELMQGPMLQALLEERFALRIHRESRTGPVYALVLARSGSRLKAFVESDCVRIPAGTPPPDLRTGQRYCRSMIGMSPPRVDADGASLDEFAKLLSVFLDRPVVNRSELAGRFAIHLEFAADDATPGIGGPVRDGASPVPDPDRSPIFTAIQEQLGLRLEAATGPVESLVIDRMERPSEN